MFKTNVESEARYYFNSPQVIHDYFPSQTLTKKIESTVSKKTHEAARLHLGFDLGSMVEIAEGSTSSVWKGSLYNFNTSTQLPAIIKIASSNSELQPLLQGTFYLENEVYQILNCSKVRHIPSSVYLIDDALTHANQGISLALVLPYKGITLTKTTLKLFSTIQKVLKQALETLEDCARLKIVHCDLKCDNILIENETITIIDWGNAVQAGNPMREARTTSYYRSPECFLNEHPALALCNLVDTHEKYTTAIDIWSLGCIFYIMATDRFPFAAKDHKMLTKMASKLGSPPADLVAKSYNRQVYTSLANVQLEVDIWSVFQKAISSKGASPKKTSEAVLLLKQMLAWDPTKRITATEALKSPLFKPELSAKAAVYIPSSSSSSSSSSLASNVKK